MNIRWSYSEKFYISRTTPPVTCGNERLWKMVPPFWDRTCEGYSRITSSQILFQRKILRVVMQLWCDFTKSNHHQVSLENLNHHITAIQAYYIQVSSVIIPRVYSQRGWQLCSLHPCTWLGRLGIVPTNLWGPTICWTTYFVSWRELAITLYNDKRLVVHFIFMDIYPFSLETDLVRLFSRW